MSNFKLYYINLDSRPDRNKHMMGELHNLKNIPYERFSAIQPNLTELVKKEVINRNTYLEIISNRIVGGHYLTVGSLGCFLSHLELWKWSYQNQQNIIVLEDDVKLLPGFETEIQKVDDFDFLYLAQLIDNWKVGAISYPNTWQIKSDYWGLYGYAVNWEYAGKLLQKCSQISCQIDSWLQPINKQLNGKIHLLKNYVVTTDNSHGRDSDCQHYALKSFYIPKIIHQILPDKQGKTIFSVWSDWSDWEYRAWTLKEISEEFGELTQNTKFDIINRYGGFYISNKWTCHRNFENLVAGYHKVTIKQMENDFFGSVKSSYTLPEKSQEFLELENFIVSVKPYSWTIFMTSE